MQYKDLIGAYVEITSLECPAGYGDFKVCACLIRNESILFGYGSGAAGQQYDSKTFSIGSQENVVKYDTYTLEIGDKLIFWNGFGLVDNNFVNWVNNHAKIIHINNEKYRLKCNDKYVEKVNNKNVRKLNNYELLPFKHISKNRTIVEFSLSENRTLNNQLFITQILNLEPIKIYLNEEIIVDFQPTEENLFQTVQLFDQSPKLIANVLYKLEIVGGWSTCLWLIALIGNATIHSVSLGDNIACIYPFMGDFETTTPLVNSIYTQLTNYVNYKVFVCECDLDCYISNRCKVLAYSRGDVNTYLHVHIPRSVFLVIGNPSATLSASSKELSFTFEHRETDTLIFTNKPFGKLKAAQAITIYHYGNPTVLNHDWAADNYTPTFVDLREQQ